MGDVSGGLELRIDDRHSILLELGDGRVSAIAHIGSMTSVLGEAPHDKGHRLEVRVERSDGPVVSARLGVAEKVADVVRPEGRPALGRAGSPRRFTETSRGMADWTVGLVTPAGTASVRSICHRGADEPTPSMPGTSQVTTSGELSHVHA
jgi:xylan 1,4-beta-xylosidase